jgi:hypothetical protein
MLRLLAMGNSLNAVIQTLGKEFNCKEWVIYKDHKRMRTWVHSIEQDEALCGILREKLDLLSREAMNLMLDWDNKRNLSVAEKFVKIGALNSALKVTVEQIKFAQELGLVERRPVEINQNLSVNTPFEADPVLRQALLNSIEKQRAEKETLDKQKAEKDASAKPKDSAGA